MAWSCVKCGATNVDQSGICERCLELRGEDAPAANASGGTRVPSGKTVRVYTPSQIGFASFLGSPIAGAVLMVENGRLINASSVSDWGGLVVVTAGAFALYYLVPSHWTPGRLLVGVLSALAMKYWAMYNQGDLTTGARLPNAVRHSWWRAIGVTFLVALVLAMIIYLWAWLVGHR